MATEVPRPAAELEAEIARLKAVLAQVERERDEAQQREAEAKTHEQQALEQQAATAEVLRVVASSPTGVQSVLDTIVEAAACLCDAPGGVIMQLREADGRLAPRASYGAMRDVQMRRYHDPFVDAPGMPATRESASGR